MRSGGASSQRRKASSGERKQGRGSVEGVVQRRGSRSGEARRKARRANKRKNKIEKTTRLAHNKKGVLALLPLARRLLGFRRITVELAAVNCENKKSRTTPFFVEHGSSPSSRLRVQRPSYCSLQACSSCCLKENSSYHVRISALTTLSSCCIRLERRRCETQSSSVICKVIHRIFAAREILSRRIREQRKDVNCPRIALNSIRQVRDRCKLRQYEKQGRQKATNRCKA